VGVGGGGGGGGGGDMVIYESSRARGRDDSFVCVVCIYILFIGVVCVVYIYILFIGVVYATQVRG